MRLCIGCDHGGYALKEEVKKYLLEKYDVVDVGCVSNERCDYPIYAKKVANSVALGNTDFGILICTTGIGVSIAANKVKGVRAAVVHNEDIAMLSRLHNNANVICLGAKYTTFEEAKTYIEIFLNQFFDGDVNPTSRHMNRVKLIEKMEE